MPPSVRLFITALLGSLLLAGCKTGELLQLALQEREYAEDRLLEAEIAGELAADPNLAGADIEVAVFRKQVTLRGRAQPLQFRRAAEIAQVVPLVESVDPAAPPAETLAGADE